jgi:hypothetical protein
MSMGLMKTLIASLLLLPVCASSSNADVLDQVQASSETATRLSRTFADGFRAGYKKAYPLGICPIPPIPPIGRNTYGDGYGIGYSRGLIDKP